MEPVESGGFAKNPALAKGLKLFKASTYAISFVVFSALLSESADLKIQSEVRLTLQKIPFWSERGRRSDSSRPRVLPMSSRWAGKLATTPMTYISKRFQL